MHIFMVGNVNVQCELLLIWIFQFLRPQENMKFIHGRHFEFQWNLEQEPCGSEHYWELFFALDWSWYLSNGSCIVKLKSKQIYIFRQ